MSASYYQHHAGPSFPVDVPTKRVDNLYSTPHHHRTPSGYSQYSVSPPERPESVSTTSNGRLYSSPSIHDTSSDYETSPAPDSLDLLDYMRDRLSTVYDPTHLDRGIVKQAQRSGELNSKQRELMALQAQARARLSQTRAKYADGMKAAREVQRDLEWTQKKVTSLNARAAVKYPGEYRLARQQFPAPSEL